MNKYPEELIDALTKGTYIFIGAGISKLAGYPLWNELAYLLIELFWDQKEQVPNPNFSFNYTQKDHLFTLLKTKDNPIMVMDFLASINEEHFYNSLKSIFDDVRAGKENPNIFMRFNELKNIVSNKFIQVNIDDGFQRALKIGDNEIDVNDNFSDKKLTYLHGKIGNKHSIVFLRRKYDDGYLDERSKIMEYLIPIFRNNNVVFFGYSLRDYEILQAISRARIQSNRSGNKPRKHYLFEAVWESKSTEYEIAREYYSRNYDVEMLRYDLSDKDYKKMFDVIDDVSQEVNKKYQLEKQNDPLRREVTGEHNATP